MSLSDNYKPVKYIGNGVTKDFSFNFNMIDSAYCRVFLQDIETGEQTPKTIEVDYTLNFGDDGGTVSMKVAPTTEQYIVVYRDVSLDQKSDFRVGDTFSATKIEEEFDKQMAAIQQMEDGLNRSPKVPEGYSVNLTLPAPDAGKGLIWNAEENGFENSTLNIDDIEQLTLQYRNESQAARDEAQGYASNAKASEDNAKISETNAANSSSQAQNSEQAAQASAEEAKQYAEKSSFGNIGDIKYTSRTDVPNGGAWCDGAEYTHAMFPDIYQMLVDGKLQSTTYQNFASLVSTNGYCEFFALDTSAQKFKVPSLPDKYVIDTNATSPVKGNGLNLGMTDGTTYVALQCGSSYQVFTDTRAYGANIGDTSYSGGSGITTEHGLGVTTDASKSGIIADTSATGKLAKLKAYVVLYASAAEASVAQAQEFMTALGGKANVALDNITADAKNLIAGLSMPSEKYIDLDLQFTNIGGNYTAESDPAPANGYYVFIRRQLEASKLLRLDNINTNISSSVFSTSSYQTLAVYVPAKKQGVAKFSYNGNGDNMTTRFIYAEGSKE